MLPLYVKKYLQARGPEGRWAISGVAGMGYDGAVVIPSLAENEFLFPTLKSLARNPKDTLPRFLIVVVVNHRQEAPISDKINNLRTLERLSSGRGFLQDLQLAWVDAASPGLELPAKIGGVGLARKIGLDLALSRLDYGRTSPILLSLDADTLCRPDYLPAIARHFQKTEVPGAVIPFCHQPGASEEQDRAIRRYELFLRAYVLGLARAGSPYAFHTVGSAMACTAEAYVRIGGMKVREAGEDFYFLEHLGKVGGVAQVRGTVVYPSSRTSQRVPFGTGRSMSGLLTKGEGAVLFYQTACFRVLAEWLALIAQSLERGGEDILSEAEKISPVLFHYLYRIKFATLWEKLKKNSQSPSALLQGFHGWFDGLKTMRLIHTLSAGPFPRGEPEEILPELLHWSGLEPVAGIQGQLELLRKVQIGEAYEMQSSFYDLNLCPTEIAADCNQR